MASVHTLTGLLSNIITSCPHVALDAPPQLKEVFAYLSLLPPPAAIELLRTVLVCYCKHG